MSDVTDPVGAVADPDVGFDGWPAGVDVLLKDGSTAHLRALTPADVPPVTAFHDGLSLDTVHLGYFRAHPYLSELELERLTRSDSPDHLAGAAKRYGTKRFAADALAQNRRMLAVFADVGFARRSSWDHDVVNVVMDIVPSHEALEAADRRDAVAVVRSMERLLRPRSVAVIGASRHVGTIGYELVRNLVGTGFEGLVYPINRLTDHVASIPCWSGIEAVPDQVDLAVIAVPASRVAETVEACGRKGVGALVVVSAGFAEAGEQGVAAQAAILRSARAHSMRMVGPNCFGLLNTAPEVSMNATFAADVPIAGRVAFGSQSGGSASPFWPRPRAAIWGCRASCRSATRPTSAATTSSPGGSRTTPPTSSSCTSSRSGTLASSPGWRRGWAAPSRSWW